MLIGYARVTVQGQSIDHQVAALRSAGCDKIFCDKAFGKAVRDRPQLKKAIDALGVNDVLVLAEWDRATRSMIDGVTIMQRVAERDALLKAIDKPWLDLTTVMGKGILAFFSALAEAERERIVSRAAHGRSIAKAKGVKFGRKPKLTAHQIEKARERLAAGDTCRDIGRDMGVSHSTISRLGDPRMSLVGPRD